MPDRVRVAITGVGAKVPAGGCARSAFETVLAGESLARELLFEGFDGRYLGCTVDDAHLEGYFSRRLGLGLDRTARLGVAAAMDAFHDSGLEGVVDAGRVTVHAGVGGAGLAATAEQMALAHERAGVPVGALYVTMMMPNAVAARVSLMCGFGGPATTHATACASGTTAIGQGLASIRRGAADVVLAGGAEAPLAPLVLTAFGKTGALSRRFDAPDVASRPFDRDRDGFVMGEGAAFLVLERWEHAVARGARIYAAVSGYAENSDAFHIVAPRPDAAAAETCIRSALADAGVAPEEVGHVNAHGTSTLRNDAAEALALGRIFGDQVPVTATKGVTGHMIGASGAFETVVTALSLADGVVPPVANFGGQGDDPPVNVVAGNPLHVAGRPAVTTSFAFGGHNAALVLTPYSAPASGAHGPAAGGDRSCG